MRRFALLAPLALVALAPAGASLAPGAEAPDFSTRGAVAGKVIPVHLKAELKKGPVVLYFFPAAFTGGCNAEAHAFAEAIDDFHKAGAEVIGMSADPVDTLAKFSSEKCAGKFAVASAGPKVIAGYDVLHAGQVKLPDGKMHTITTRTSYVIAPDGHVLLVHSDMDPSQHVAKTLAAVQEWRAAHPA